MKLSVYWFRRDLRFEDNTALIKALNDNCPVLPVFIFDENILSELATNDARVSFIYKRLHELNQILAGKGSSLLVMKGKPLNIWEKIIKQFEIGNVYFNKDYEPYAIQRDYAIKRFLEKRGISVYSFKDQVIFEENDIVKDNGKPYLVYTPYKNKWLAQLNNVNIKPGTDINFENFLKGKHQFPSLSDMGFQVSEMIVKSFNIAAIDNYEKRRDFPAYETTNLGPHLRFGTISIRQIIDQVDRTRYRVFISELIWREFFMQIIFHFPHIVTESFKPQYNGIEWRNNNKEFNLWCEGKTGYPLVDAGMRQLNQTGYLHNRVRMVVAGFLCKHLLIDWRWGEAYFAKKLIDYELSSNNGNWQWAAGTGCDAAPYFRIFNPSGQIKKFDSKFEYIKRWLPEFGSIGYPVPIVGHKFARQRAIETYRRSLTGIRH